MLDRKIDSSESNINLYIVLEISYGSPAKECTVCKFFALDLNIGDRTGGLGGVRGPAVCER